MPRFTPEQVARLDECRVLAEAYYAEAIELRRLADLARDKHDALCAERFSIVNGLRCP